MERTLVYNLTQSVRQLDRRLRLTLRHCDEDAMSRQAKQDIAQLKLALNEIRLDVRDYEYAQTRLDQEKWRKLGRHNLKVLNTLLLRLDTIFGPADTAELGAYIDEISAALV